MRTLGNIVWHFPFLGFLTSLYTFIIGGFFILTVVGAPIGLGLIQHSKFLLSPFSSRMVSDKKIGKERSVLWKIFGIVALIIYLPLGIFATIVTLIQIMLLFISIVGVPVAVVLSKSLSTYLNPVGKICISVDLDDAIKRQNADKKASDILN